MGTLKLFGESNADQFIRSQHEKLKATVDNENEDYILKVESSEYAKHIEAQFVIDFPEIHKDKATAENSEMDVPGRYFPTSFFADPSKTYKRDTVVFHVPYTGDIRLLGLQPNTYTLNIGTTLEYDDREKVILIQIINFYDDPVKIKQEFEGMLNMIFKNYGFLKDMFDRYHYSLNSVIESQIDRRRERIQSTRNLLLEIGVPIKKKADTPETFSIPKPKTRNRIEIAKPKVSPEEFKPEPALDDTSYFEILKIVNDVGKNFERMPSVYSQKKEEDLRDHFLMVLDPNFELGSASGETFNKTGKTDIQLRYDSSVVFVAECKFWSGEKGFLQTLDQLLSYLTWRDSKTSAIVFVRNKDFSSVLKTMQQSIATHPEFATEKSQSDETWFNYIFSLPDDSNKKIKLAVQLFHIP